MSGPVRQQQPGGVSMEMVGLRYPSAPHLNPQWREPWQGREQSDTSSECGSSSSSRTGGNGGRRGGAA